MDKNLFEQYYTKYYRDTLGLKFYKEHVEKRFKENETSLAQIQQRLSFFPIPIPDKGKVLIVGGGTGAELCAFHALGYQAIMTEQNDIALELSRQNALDHNIDTSCVVKTDGDTLPFEDASFDFVWSWTVLEHVNCYKTVLSEISRILRPNAWGFLTFPDYRCIRESHYKTHLPLFMPKWITALILRLKGINPSFFNNNVNMINHLKFVRMAKELPLHTFRYHIPLDNQWKYNRTFAMNIAYFMLKYFDIEYTLSYYVKKIGKNEL